MWKDIFTSTKSLGSNAMSFVLQSVKSRKVGANEAADRLLGKKLYSKSRQLRFADLQPADKAKRVLKTAYNIGKLLEDSPESSDIFYPHWVLDIYPQRPDELESSSLHDIMSWYEKEKLTAGSSKPLQLKKTSILSSSAKDNTLHCNTPNSKSSSVRRKQGNILLLSVKTI